MATGTFKNNYKGYTVRAYWSSVINIADNSSTITVDHWLDCAATYDLYISARTNTATVDGEPVPFTSPGISTAGNQSIKLGTTTHKVTHNSDGKKTVTASTKFLMQASIAGTWIESITATGTMVLDDIPRASTLIANNGTLGVAQTLTINKSDSSFTHTISYTCGNATGTIATKTANASVSFTPPLSLASQNTTGSSVSVVFTIDTYNGNTKVGSSTKTITCTIPSSVKPTANVTVSDAMGYATTYGGYIQGMSKFKVTVTGTPIYNSPIASYSTTANGSTYTSSSFTTDVIQNSGTATITGKVTDKRGNSGTKSVTATVLAYSKPKITKWSVARCNQNGTENMQGEYAKVTYSCSITSLNSKNTLTSVIKYYTPSDPDKVTSVTDINASTVASFENQTFIFKADSSSSYTIELDITDKFDTTPKITSVSTAFTFHHYKGPNVEAEGKNKFDYANEANYYNATGYPATLSKIDNGIRVTRKSTGSTYAYSSYTMSKIDHLLGKTMNLSYTSKASSTNDIGVRVYWMDPSNRSFKTMIANFATPSGGSFTLPSAPPVAGYGLAILFYANRDSTTAAEGCYVDYTYIQLEEGSVATEYEPYISEYPASMGLGKIVELPGGLDIGFKTRFANGLVYPVIPVDTDFDDLLTPNFYAGANVAEYNYTNCPITGGTFYLEIVSAGDGGLRQSITTCSKEASVTYERFYHDGSWGPWRDCYYGQEVLYDNSSGSTGTITLLKNVSNFAFIDIYYTDNNGKSGGHTRIETPNGKTIVLDIVEPGSAATWIRRTVYTISATALTPTTSSAGFVKMDSSGVAHTVATNYIKITKVMGIR